MPLGLVLLLLFSCLLILMYCVFPWLVGRYSRAILRRNCIDRKNIVLTLDDGPGNRLTPKILEILAELNLKASFFLLGRNIAGREEIVRRIAAEGHDICSHGFNHLHAWKVWPWQSIRDIKRGWQVIDCALGIHKGIYPFRPPYGKLNLVTLLYLWGKRAPLIFWTADIGDTWSQEKRKNRINREWGKLRKGAVVLAHDFDRATDKMDDYVLDAVREYLTIARESQLKVCSLSELRKAIG
jgi:peptidoglycan/xylan/chitin deacetylase (PgdA/CDA1 family)